MTKVGTGNWKLSKSPELASNNQQKNCWPIGAGGDGTTISTSLKNERSIWDHLLKCRWYVRFMEENCEHDSKLQQLLQLKAKKIVDLGVIKPSESCPFPRWLFQRRMATNIPVLMSGKSMLSLVLMHSPCCEWITWWSMMETPTTSPPWTSAVVIGRFLWRSHQSSTLHFPHYPDTCWFTVRPFGLHGAPATLQRLLDIVLRGFKSFVATYPDDVAIFSHSRGHHFITYNGSCYM